jgi:hypothetical protein
MHIATLKDNLNKRVTCYPWVPTKFMKGDLFNKIHAAGPHAELCQQNGIHAEKISLISTEPVPLVIHGWEKVIEEERKREKKEEG